MFLFEIVDPIINLFHWKVLAELNIGTVLFRLVLAVICGGVIGFERAKKHQAAGFRTYILVCLGSAIAMLTNEFISRATNMGDGARLGAQVISGIGFLGAGTILVTSRNQIRGLTTAAGLWACACLGLSIGIGFYTLAIFGTIVISIVLAILPKIESTFNRKSTYFEIHIEFQTRENLKQFVNLIRQMNFRVISIEHNPAYSASGLSVYTIALKVQEKKKKINHQEYLDIFSKLDYVNFVEEIY